MVWGPSHSVTAFCVPACRCVLGSAMPVWLKVAWTWGSPLLCSALLGDSHCDFPEAHWCQLVPEPSWWVILYFQVPVDLPSQCLSLVLRSVPLCPLSLCLLSIVLVLRYGHPWAEDWNNHMEWYDSSCPPKFPSSWEDGKVQCKVCFKVKKYRF